MSTYDEPATVPTPVDPPVATPPPGPDVPAGPGWRERLWSVRSVIAVGLAGLLLGAAGGALLGYAAHDDARGGPGRGGFPGGGFAPGQRGQLGQQGLPGAPGSGVQPGLPGQSLPSTPPTDTPQPDGGATPSSTT